MKIAIIHLSDFHIKNGSRFIIEKIRKISDATSACGSVDECIIVFSGDLAWSGKMEEYKQSRFVFNNLITGLKEKLNGKYIKLIMVPGNHDLCLPENSRNQKDIQFYYDEGLIDKYVETELGFLDNYYNYSHANSQIIRDKIINKYFCSYEDFTIQFNLINTSLFSTLEPNDKELHYFPHDKLRFLKKSEDANLCITVMHHTSEWFNWKYKADLEKEIINNSDILCTGHDHFGESKTLIIEKSFDTWISCAGEMKFDENNYSDSFNAIVIDTENSSFDAYRFEWNSRNRIYINNHILVKKMLNKYRNIITPLPSFLKTIKEDDYNRSKNFLDYFVFPKLITRKENELKKLKEISTFTELKDIIEQNKRIVIIGPSNSGKTTLLKYIYDSYCGDKIPLIVQVDSSTRLNPNNFIKRAFEDQYGEDKYLYDVYIQTSKDKKVFIIDGWDHLSNNHNKKVLMERLKETADIIILSIYPYQKDVVETVKNELFENDSFFELSIRPFFTEKRNELIRNICTIRSTYNDEDISRINSIIDSLVQNNNHLFSLYPAFIIQYTDYFLKSGSYDYVNGEAVFSKVFEYELTKSIIEFTRKDDVDEVLTVFEEIAGFMFKNRKDIVKIEDIRDIILNYNKEYGVSVDSSRFMEVGIRSKVFKQTKDLEVYFSNKNFLSYFIAKYLLRLAQSEEQDYFGIEYALKNICFGINSDIILFILYLSDNTKMVVSISDFAGKLLSPWEELDFDKNNVHFLSNTYENEVSAPTDKECKEYVNKKEKLEELQYNDEEVDAIGLFEYDEGTIDNFHNRLVRAIKYTEMICKALPSFNSKLKMAQKKQLIDSIYKYPHKIAFAILNPIDYRFDEICKNLLNLTKEYEIKKKNGSSYSIDDIKRMLSNISYDITLGMYDHFSELCTSGKTYNRLLEKTEKLSFNQEIQRLMIIDNAGKTDELIKEADYLLKNTNNIVYKNLITMVIRKHLICTPQIQFNKKQRIIDKFFNKDAKKELLLSTR